MNDAAPVTFLEIEGTTRACSPRETIERVMPLLPVFGITRVANVTGLDTIGIPVVMVTRPNARSVSVSQGKGATLDAAKASGLMEAIEIHHAEHILAPLLLGSYNELRFRETVVDVTSMALSTRKDLTATARLLWIQGYELVTGDPVWVPYEAVHTDFRTPFPEGSGYFLCTSNGLASGNTIEEAICHGLSEVIERDCLALWRLRSREDRDRCELDLSTVTDPHCRALLDRYAAAGVPVRAWNLTSEIGVPVFNVWIPTPPTGMPISVSGFDGHGCHPFAHIALSRALSEAAQGRLTMIAGVRDDIDPTYYDERPDETPVVPPVAETRSAPPPVSYGDVPSLQGRSSRALIERMVERLSAIGLEQVIVVDLTRAEFNIPVARVIVPGLEGNPNARLYRPGRRALRAAGIDPEQGAAS
ncbi:YcaO-like family protein [Thalassobaculum sp. OXR-137]|uniref:YcaO-like family protein n=1 Tax=Thalassobaculum sp. OXR-137 TaxID=3100173 RepID=UPI002AC8BFF9|nr:YcaO-like family protein [Thalassobaculum sp. OXR-137]WPZ33478.1 YcaO-like family protein [Thalassobaculum sp. OXR-137]